MPRLMLSNMYAELGGGELALLAHAEHLKAQGHAVCVGLLEGGPFEARLAEAGIESFVVPFAWQGGKVRSARHLLACARRFGDEMRRRGTQCVVAYTFNDFVLAGAAARLRGVPVMLRAQGEIAPPGGSAARTWLGRLFVPFVKWTQARIVCTTRAEAEALVRAGVPAAQVCTVYLGVDEALATTPRSRPEDDGPPVVAMFGRLVRWKGQDVFLRALGLLRRQGVPFRAWIVGSASFGDGEDYEAELRRIVSEEGLEASVSFLGFRRDVAQLMADCDIVCHASRFEPFGLVVVEAMMAGRAVVAADVSGPRESVVPGETGLLVPPGDPKPLADALGRLLLDSALMKSLATNGQQRARSHFAAGKNLGLLDQEIGALLRGA